MKESTDMIIQSAYSFDEKEMEVSNILLNLKDLIEESESRNRVPSLKLQRRGIDRNLDFNSSSTTNSVQRNFQVKDESDNVEPCENDNRNNGKVMTNLNGQGSETCHTLQYPMGQVLQEQPMFFLSANYGLGFVNLLSYFEHNRGLAERKAQYAEARRKRRMKRIEIKRSYGLTKEINN